MLTVGNVRERKKLHKVLKTLFENQGEERDQRITDPSGQEVFKVWWIKKHAIWAYFSADANRRLLRIWFGTELPDDPNTAVTMGVEMNLSLEPDNYRHRGRCVVDSSHMYLGHRGGLGGGRGGQVKIEDFIKRIVGFQTKTVRIDEQKYEEDFVLGPIESASFLAELSKYVHECHRLRSKAKSASAPNLGETLGSDEADEEFDPSTAEDERKKTWAQIKARRGQRSFRDKLLKAYGRRCAITGCPVVDVLEAAHVTPYLGDDTHHVTNGLLLRADLHTLLDCGLLTVDPKSRKVVMHSTVRKSTGYAGLHGKILKNPKPLNARPTTKILLALKGNSRR